MLQNYSILNVNMEQSLIQVLPVRLGQPQSMVSFQLSEDNIGEFFRIIDGSALIMAESYRQIPFLEDQCEQHGNIMPIHEMIDVLKLAQLIWPTKRVTSVERLFQLCKEAKHSQ